jgi:hypothetical protein
VEIRRRLWLGLSLLLIVALVVGGLFYWLSLPFPVRVYHSLRVGMTLAEVEQTIGSPPGNQPEITDVNSRNPYTEIERKGYLAPGVKFHHGPRWIWKDYLIWLEAGDDDKVVIIILMKSGQLNSYMKQE